jgi:hypothetical protein
VNLCESVGVRCVPPGVLCRRWCWSRALRAFAAAALTRALICLPFFDSKFCATSTARVTSTVVAPMLRSTCGRARALVCCRGVFDSVHCSRC